MATQETKTTKMLNKVFKENMECLNLQVFQYTWNHNYGIGQPMKYNHVR